jgi:hypothetical protein
VECNSRVLGQASLLTMCACEPRCGWGASIRLRFGVCRCAVRRFAASQRPIPRHPHFEVGHRPTRSVIVHEHDPHQRSLMAVVDDEVRPAGTFGRLQVKRWIELGDHVSPTAWLTERSFHFEKIAKVKCNEACAAELSSRRRNQMPASITQDHRRKATLADRRTGHPSGKSTERTLESVLESAASIAMQVNRYAGIAHRNARNVRPYFVKSFGKRPVTTVAGCFVVGFALGALWK